MARNSKVAIEVEIKNIKKIADLKQELKELRKAQREQEKESKSGRLQSHKNAKAYKERAKAIKQNSKELRDLNKQMSSTTQVTQKATKSQNAMAKQFIKGAAALGIIVGAFRTVSNAISSVVRTFTEFEFTMSKVLAVSGATDSEFKALTATAEELGRTTFFTAEQVGQLQLAFSKLGFTAAEIQDAVKPTLDLATATGTDLARAAQVAGAAVRGFGLDASETERVVDVMAVSFSSSAMDIEKWQTGMTKVAPIAKAAGFSIEDTAAIMSKLSDSGIEASIAGTSLRNILLKMQDPTSELSMRFGRTIHSLDDLVPAMKQFIAEGGSMADIMEVVDLRQAAAFEQMLTTADGTLKLRDELKNANGEGERMAALVGDTLQGAFLKLKSALQGVSISLMKDFAEGMQSAVEKAANFFNMIAENSKTITNAIKFLTKLVRVIGLYKLGVFAASKAMLIYNKRFVIARLVTIKLATATKGLTLSVNGLKIAVKSLLGSTGIGLLLAFAPEILNFFGLWKDETDDVAEATDTLSESQKQLDNVFKDANAESEKTKLQFEQLIGLKEEMNKMLNKEGELLENTETNQKVYNGLKGQAAILIRELNKELKDNDQALIDEKTSIDNLTIAMDKLTTSMMQQAIAEGFKERMGVITSNAASARLALIELRKEVDAASDEELLDMNFDYAVADVPNTDIGARNAQSLIQGAQTQFQLTTDNIKKIFEKYNIDFTGDISETISNLVSDSSSADDAVKSLRESYMSLIDELGLDAMSVFGTGTNTGGGGGGDGDGQEVTDWSIKTKEALNEVKKQLLDNQLSEEGYRDAVIDVRKDMLQQELNSLEDNKTNAKRILEIKTQYLELEIQERKNSFSDGLRLLQENLRAEQEQIKNDHTVNGKLTAEGQNAMIQSEIDFLNAKKKLHGDYAMYLVNIDEDIAASNRKLQEQQIKNFNEQVSAMGGVGSALTKLAGDNERLNAVKEAGNKINQIANTIQAIQTLQTNLQTIADGKQTIATLLKTKSEVAESSVVASQTPLIYANTAAEMMSIGPKVASGAASQAKLQFPLNIIAVIATIALLSKIMKMFEKGGIVDEFGKGGVIKKFADGGMVQGRSHAQGGEKFAVGGRVVELEGGEAVINKRSTAMYRDQLSAINQAGGGVKFADGGLMNLPQFANQQFTRAVGGSGMQKVVVVESDITQSQRTVNVLESQATI
jgi:TP901 family phage tail tape measure protein